MSQRTVTGFLPGICLYPSFLELEDRFFPEMEENGSALKLRFDRERELSFPKKEEDLFPICGDGEAEIGSGIAL
jgi:hypothetical protein